MKTNEEIVLICAFRYALGRSTYVVSSVIDEIIGNWSGLSRGAQLLIKNEIETAIRQNAAGEEADIEDWQRIRMYLPIKREEEK